VGRKTIQLTVELAVSNHNSEQDDTDIGLARDLASRIKAIAEESQYADIMMFAPDPDALEYFG
jgi:hypothetical protein